MRIYYVFDIKKEYISLYDNTPSSLYSVLNQLYHLRKKDLEHGFNMFKQLTNKIDNESVDKDIFLKMHKKMTYSKKNNSHIINNLYKDEISVLVAKKAYILINSNKNFTEFFNILAQSNKNYFVCDFNNNDYFFISSVKMLV
ncbi:MAG: sporulation inhibitor of replication protein SirA [bacterium]|nr:sporulation inhibitor of replication protein SirA [bacterium]